MRIVKYTRVPTCGNVEGRCGAECKGDVSSTAWLGRSCRGTDREPVSTVLTGPVAKPQGADKALCTRETRQQSSMGMLCCKNAASAYMWTHTQATQSSVTSEYCPKSLPQPQKHTILNPNQGKRTTSKAYLNLDCFRQLPSVDFTALCVNHDSYAVPDTKCEGKSV